MRHNPAHPLHQRRSELRLWGLNPEYADMPWHPPRQYGYYHPAYLLKHTRKIALFSLQRQLLALPLRPTPGDDAEAWVPHIHIPFRRRRTPALPIVDITVDLYSQDGCRLMRADVLLCVRPDQRRFDNMPDIRSIVGWDDLGRMEYTPHLTLELALQIQRQRMAARCGTSPAPAVIAWHDIYDYRLPNDPTHAELERTMDSFRETDSASDTSVESWEQIMTLEDWDPWDVDVQPDATSDLVM